MPDDERTAAGAHLAHELGFGQHGSQRGIATTDPLGADDQVGNHAPMVETPAPAGAPEAGHHLVGDKEDTIAVTYLADALEISRGGGNHAEGGADHRLGDERRDIVDTDLADGVLQLVGAGEIALGTRPIRVAAIRVTRRYARRAVGSRRKAGGAPRFH